MIVESFKFIEGAITGITGTTDLSIDAQSTTIENMKCAASACEHKSGSTNALTLQDASFLNGAVSAKTLALDPNSASGGAITVTNTATQSSGTLVTITGRAGQDALKIPAGNVNFGNGKFVINANGVSTLGANQCTSSVTAAPGTPSTTCNSMSGTVTVTLPSSGGLYPVATNRCSDQMLIANTAITSSSSVVVMSLTSPTQMAAGQAFSAGVPYLMTGTVSSGGINFWVCNIGSDDLSGTVVVKFLAAGG